MDVCKGKQQIARPQTRILHIFRDRKFFEFAYASYAESNLNIEHCFACRFPAADAPRFPNKAVHFFQSEQELQRYVFQNAKNYTAVCLHWLTFGSLKIGERIRHQTIVIPFLWGTEIYSNFSVLKKSLYLPRTRAFMRAKFSMPRRIWMYLRTWCHEARYRRFLNSVPAIVPVCPEEGEKYEMHLRIRAPRLRHAYIVSMPDQEMEKGGVHEDVSDGSVMIGNSAAMTGNHLDLLVALSKVRDFTGCVYCPLSYAGGETYLAAVCKLGKNLFGERFIPLLAFLPLKEYQSIFTRCTYILMGHKRQQAGGNIRLALRSGKTVFLFQENTFYWEYRRLGVHIRDLENFMERPALEEYRLSVQEKRQNERILREEFATERLVARNDNLFTKIHSLSVERSAPRSHCSRCGITPNFSH